jgi:hypothetical protein
VEDWTLMMLVRVLDTQEEEEEEEEEEVLVVAPGLCVSISINFQLLIGLACL